MAPRNVLFGLTLKNFTGPGEPPDIDGILAYAERGEALGFDSLWAWDHILLGHDPVFPVLESLTTLTAIAARTRRIRLGTGVFVLPMRNPVITAKVLTTLDIVSKGRLILGAASGWYAREFDAVGVPFKERGKLFERNFEVLHRKVTAQYGPLNLRQAVLAPKPHQKPRFPIWIGGYVDAVLKRVARYGDGWLTYFYTPEGFARSWSKIVGFAKEFGRDPAQITSANQLPIYVGPPASQADAPMRQWLSTEWDIAAWSDSTPESAIRGTVDECVAALQRHVDAGVQHLIFIPYKYQPDQVEILAKEVIPRLRA
jgi:probable F420-dependent oxidoreductase